MPSLKNGLRVQRCKFLVAISATKLAKVLIVTKWDLEAAETQNLFSLRTHVVTFSVSAEYSNYHVTLVCCVTISHEKCEEKRFLENVIILRECIINQESQLPSLILFVFCFQPSQIVRFQH